MTNRIEIRCLEIEDLFFLFRLRNDPSSFKWFLNSKPTSWQKHFFWFVSQFIRNRKELFLVLIDGSRAGVCYLSKKMEFDGPLVNINIFSLFRGKGLGKSLLVHVIEVQKSLGVTRVYASINESNTASLYLFESLGFERNFTHKSQMGFATFEKRLD